MPTSTAAVPKSGSFRIKPCQDQGDHADRNQDEAHVVHPVHPAVEQTTP